ncbi:Histone-lysine N-methyltransferase SUV39H2 [Nymphon striatum]|nr:Histone-lysine N-methyltransferase SUV39H2 [Nymphon striatum]
MSDDLSQSPPKSSSKTSSVVSSDDNNNSERVSDISSLFTDTGSMVNANSASESANHESILVYDTSTSSSESEIFVLLDKNESSALIMSANHTRKKRSYSSTPPIKRPKRTNTVQSYVEIHKPSNNRSSRKRLLSTTLITKEIDDDDSCDGTTGKPSNASNDDSSEEPVYEVESVLDYTVDDNVEYYLVKWKGWSESDNTWEPSSNLEGCTSLIRKFHRLNPYLKVYGKKQLDDYDDSTSGRLDAFLRRNARVIGKLVQNLTGNLNCIKGRNLKSSINEIVRSLKNEDDEVRYSVKKHVHSPSRHAQNVNTIFRMKIRPYFQCKRVFWTLPGEVCISESASSVLANSASSVLANSASMQSLMARDLDLMLIIVNNIYVDNNSAEY